MSARAGTTNGSPSAPSPRSSCGASERTRSAVWSAANSAASAPASAAVYAATRQGASRRRSLRSRGERGRRSCELVGVRDEADEDQLAPRAGGEGLGDRNQVGEPALVADEDENGAQAPARGLLQCELRVLPQDRALELAEERRRLDPELGVERLARRAVDVERLRLPAGAVEGSHERAHETLVQRMRADERLELGDELGVSAEREVGIDSQLERREAGGFEALGFRLREHVVRQLGEGLPAPESERLAEQPARAARRFGAFRLGHQLARSGAGRAGPESIRMR